MYLLMCVIPIHPNERVATCGHSEMWLTFAMGAVLCGSIVPLDYKSSYAKSVASDHPHFPPLVNRASRVFGHLTPLFLFSILLQSWSHR